MARTTWERDYARGGGLAEVPPRDTVVVKLGCMMCADGVRVGCATLGDALELSASADGIAPVSGAFLDAHSPCGLSAVQGTCRNQEGIDFLTAVVRENGIPGVQIIE